MVLFMLVGVILMVKYCKDTESVENRGQLVVAGSLFVFGNLALGIAYAVGCLLSKWLRGALIRVLVQYLINAAIWFYFRI